MAFHKRIPSGLWVAVGIVSVPALVTQMPRDRSSTDAAQFYAMAQQVIDPARGQVSADLATVYRARCGKPLTVTQLHAHLNSPFGQSAIGAAGAFRADLKACAADANACANIRSLDVDYLRSITEMSCG